MKVLRFSHDYLLNTGGMMVHLRGLNRELANCYSDISIHHVFLSGKEEIKELYQKGRIIKIGQDHVQKDAKVNLHPLIVPSKSYGLPDMDSAMSLRIFANQYEDLVKKINPDIIHIHLVKRRLQLKAIEISKKLSKPVVITHHEGAPDNKNKESNLEKSAELADYICAISRHSALAIKNRNVDYVNFFIDTLFWNKKRIKPFELEYWNSKIKLKTNEIIIVYPARFILRKNHKTLIEAFNILHSKISISKIDVSVRLILSGPATEKNRALKSTLIEFSRKLACSDQIIWCEDLSRQSLRALYSFADIVCYPSFNEGCGRSHLEGVLLDCCPIVSNDAGLAEYIRNDISGKTFEPMNSTELANCLFEITVNDELRFRLTKSAKRSISKLTLKKYAEDHYNIYSKLTKKTHSNNLQLENKVSLFPANWIEETALIVDLDQTLINPTSFSRKNKAYAFPPLYEKEISLNTEGGRNYIVRELDGDFQDILSLPWKQKCLLSLSKQDKVNECANLIRINDIPLIELMDACIGMETINIFSEANNLKSTFSNEISIYNPAGKSVRNKPVSIATIQGLAQIGEFLKTLDFNSVKNLLSNPTFVATKAICIDDKLCYERDRNIDHIIIPILPLGSYSKYKLLFTNDKDNNSKSYYAIKHIWLQSAVPFAFAKFLLHSNCSWNKLRNLSTYEGELLTTQGYSENNSQRKWLLNKSLASNQYRRYANVSNLDIDNSALLKLRKKLLTDHFKVYNLLSRTYIKKDLDKGYSVLLLGRDMDFAFEVAKTHHKDSIDQKYLACLPISRLVVENSSFSNLIEFILDALPNLNNEDTICIYDVGYKGTIFLKLKECFRESNDYGKIQVIGRMLNVASDLRKDSIYPLCFNQIGHHNEISRELALSIENLEHSKGRAKRVTENNNEIFVEYEEQSNLISRLSNKNHQILNTIMNNQRNTLNQLSSSSKIAECVLKNLLHKNPSSHSILRNVYSDLTELSILSVCENISTVIYPLSGIDFLTPLNLFKNVNHIILFDQKEISKENVNKFPDDICTEYLTELVYNYCFSPAAVTLEMRNLQNNLINKRLPMHLIHFRSLIALSHVLSEIGFTNAGYFKQLEHPFFTKSNEVSWTCQREDGADLRISYLGGNIENLRKEVLEKVREVSIQNTSAILIKASQMIFNKEKHSVWKPIIEKANLIAHDNSVIINSSLKYDSSKYQSIKSKPLYKSLTRKHFNIIGQQSKELHIRA